MSRAEAQQLELRAQLLELEAQLQRATLAATLAEWEQARARSWLLGAARVAGHALSTPRMRWLLFATLLRRLRRGRPRAE
jgi:hypothetical protein